MNRRDFMTSAALAGFGSSTSAASRQVWAASLRGRPFQWRDAENRSNISHAVFSDDGTSVALQVTRALSAGGEYPGPAWGSLLDPRADLWVLNGELAAPIRLSVLPGGAWSPSFSPDGKRLAALTMVQPGTVGLVVWDLSQGTHRVFSGFNVELFLTKFRTDQSAYGGPSDFFQVPRQYLWVDATSILCVDGGSRKPQWVLAASGLSPLLEAFRRRTERGKPSVRLWNDRSPTCGAESRLLRVSWDTGTIEPLYSGDVRGVSLSPDRKSSAVLVASRIVPPVPDHPVRWPLLGTTGSDEPMVEFKLVLIDLTRTGSIREIDGVTGVGNTAPSRLPRWTEDSSRTVVPVRASYSSEPVTGNDAVWEITRSTGEARKWPASSALDSELLAAMLTTGGVNTEDAIARRPQTVRSEDYTAGGQIRGGAWRCAPERVMFWNAPSLAILSAGHTLTLPDRFTSVDPTVLGPSRGTTLALRANGGTSLITTSTDGYRIDAVSARPDWNVMAIRPKNAGVIYKEDAEDGTFLMLARPGKRPRRSPLSFNTYFRDVLRPQRRMLSHTFADGSVRSGLLQLPVGHRAGERHPVIVWAYPNSAPSLDDSFARGNDFANVIYPVQYLLTRGFAFFQAPFPISGKKSSRPMRAAVDAVLPWLDVLGRRAEIVPGDYGFFGHSNAGYVALALEALTSRFKAIVAWDTFPQIGYDTLHSWAGDIALNCAGNLIQSDRMFYEDLKDPYAPRPAPPWKSPAQYIRSEPLFNLNRASTPLLLVEGEFDTDPREMEEVYSILYGRGVPVELAYYWGEGHVFASPGNIRDSWLRTERFFRRYLHGAQVRGA